MKLKDRYQAMENYRKLGELNEFRRRKLAMRNALNYRLELERLSGLVANQRLATLRHVEPRREHLKRLIGEVYAGYY